MRVTSQVEKDSHTKVIFWPRTSYSTFKFCTELGYLLRCQKRYF